MGRIKTQLVKRKTYELLRKFSGKFSTDFDTNKLRVNEFIPDASKKLRNTIAGYLTRLVKKNQDLA
ncbi:MAG: 30S ribosomal protein S17e [Candidatus Woesearchaeota archaeon]|nr:30S ribosomal protein S17e [Candidatus Woesearchaeota archaeon]